MMKKWYNSKEIRFGVLFVILAIAESQGFSDFIPGDDVKELAMILPIIVNIILRVFFTSRGIEKSLL